MKVICPKCKRKLIKVEEESRLICDNNHSYDISKSGYINLMLSRTASGDNKLLVNARKEFLSRKYYDFLGVFLTNIVEKYKGIGDCVIIDAGCGDGYFTHFITQELNVHPAGFDISKVAIESAAKKYKGIKFYVASIYDLPLASASIDIVLNIMAPHSNLEFARITHQNSLLIKIIPNSNHLIELKRSLYHEVYENKNNLPELNHFELIAQYDIETKTMIDLNSINLLFQMTPYFYKSFKKSIENFNNNLITFSFKGLIYKRRSDI